MAFIHLRLTRLAMGEHFRTTGMLYTITKIRFGTMAQSTDQQWIDRGTRTFPIAAEGGYLYNQEFEYDDDGSAMDSFIESAPMDIDDGDRFSLVTKVIPDMTFAGLPVLPALKPHLH